MFKIVLVISFKHPCTDVLHVLNASRLCKLKSYILLHHSGNILIIELYNFYPVKHILTHVIVVLLISFS